MAALEAAVSRTRPFTEPHVTRIINWDQWALPECDWIIYRRPVVLPPLRCERSPGMSCVAVGLCVYLYLFRFDSVCGSVGLCLADSLTPGLPRSRALGLGEAERMEAESRDEKSKGAGGLWLSCKQGSVSV